MNKEQYKTTIELRERVNHAILAKLTQYLYDNPDIRFGQALINLDIIPEPKVLVASSVLRFDIYNEEPSRVLARMEKDVK